MTPEELTAVEQRVNAATEGPWMVFPTVPNDGDTRIKAGVDGPVLGEMFTHEDGLLAANARQDIPDLLAEVRRLHDVVELLQRRMSEQCVYSAGLKAGAAALTYSSTQATRCARCGEHKHTPLRRDEMHGYVCLTCIDAELERHADEPRYSTEAVLALLNELPSEPVMSTKQWGGILAAAEDVRASLEPKP